MIITTEEPLKSQQGILLKLSPLYLIHKPAESAHNLPGIDCSDTSWTSSHAHHPHHCCFKSNIRNAVSSIQSRELGV